MAQSFSSSVTSHALSSVSSVRVPCGTNPDTGKPAYATFRLDGDHGTEVLVITELRRIARTDPESSISVSRPKVGTVFTVAVKSVMLASALADVLAGLMTDAGQTVPSEGKLEPKKGSRKGKDPSTNGEPTPATVGNGQPATA